MMELSVLLDEIKINYASIAGFYLDAQALMKQ